MARCDGPRSGDGGRGPGAQRKAKVGARLFGFFFVDWKKKLARKARNKTFRKRGKEYVRRSTVLGLRLWIPACARMTEVDRDLYVRRETKRSAHAVMNTHHRVTLGFADGSTQPTKRVARKARNKTFSTLGNEYLCTSTVHGSRLWIPAYAGMTEVYSNTTVIPAKAAVRRLGIQCSGAKCDSGFVSPMLGFADGSTKPTILGCPHAGKYIPNVFTPSRLSTNTSPPCINAIALTIANPNP